MPMEVGIWKLGERPKRIEYSAMDSERRLEETLVKDLSILASDLLLLGRQVPTSYGKYIDMLALDRDGQLVVIELKRNRTPREVVAQLLDYASWVQQLSYGDIKTIFEERSDETEFEEAFAEHFGGSVPEKVNDSHELVVVCAELDPSTERIIAYLSEGYSVPINAVFFRYFRDGDSEYLTRSWLVDPDEVEVSIDRKKSAKGGSSEIWNKRDFYVSFGVDQNRSWEDARRYGFISAGFGKWYSQTLYNLKPGHRVWVNIPGKGYVGVGEVVGVAKPAREFTVDIDGQKRRFLDAPRNAEYLESYIDDDDMCEHFVPVRWIRDVPEERAYWEKGLFAKQHSACKLRNQFTIERLSRHFDLED